MSKEKDFKVVDRRASSGATDEAETKEGPGFTMKEGEEHGPDNIDFSTFIFSLATGAFINLGLAPDPLTGKQEKNLKFARQNIDILLLIRDKTKGNLNEQEKNMLDGLLSETQLRFVEVSKQ